MGIDLDELLKKQREYFDSGATLSVESRISGLKRLQAAIKAREADIADALKADLGKSAFESYMCETGLALSEISYMIKHVRAFAKERRVHTPLAQFAARSYVKPSPYGVTLIMSPWNYPLLLTIDPLADALAAGNTAVIKPSAYSPATSSIVADIVAECFDPAHVAVVTGGRKENADLLTKKFDLVFFTGGMTVGREVLRAAAETLTPVVLELGGKSPCIVDETAKLKLAAKRIAFGKFLNCGQTCVAPDYVLCHKSVADDFIRELRGQIIAQFGERPLDNPDYGRIVNEKHFARLCGLMNGGTIAVGGQTDAAALRIAPTVLESAWTDEVMREEIFGPILPVLTYDDFQEVIPLLAGLPKPLALYIFSEDKKRVRAVTERCAFGGGCVNDVVIHLATSEMGFGGIGESGMGAYHGKTGFDAFTHYKSIVDKKTWIDLPIRYQPYKKGNEKPLRRFLK